MKGFALLAALIAFGTADAAEQEFAQCILCHGTNANGNYGVRAPKLTGLDRAYLLRQFDAFRSDFRGTHKDDVSGSEMRIVARSLSKDAIPRAVDFIGSLAAKRPSATVQGNSQKGAVLFAACASCHGEKGQGNPSFNAPALAGMSDWYLAIQLNNYRNGLRGYDSKDANGTVMKAASMALPDTQAIYDVVAYINTL